MKRNVELVPQNRSHKKSCSEINTKRVYTNQFALPKKKISSLPKEGRNSKGMKNKNEKIT
jgi:hypothetical protein